MSLFNTFTSSWQYFCFSNQFYIMTWRWIHSLGKVLYRFFTLSSRGQFFFPTLNHVMVLFINSFLWFWVKLFLFFFLIAGWSIPFKNYFIFKKDIFLLVSVTYFPFLKLSTNLFLWSPSFLIGSAFLVAKHSSLLLSLLKEYNILGRPLHMWVTSLS